MSALFACTRCAQRFPFEELSDSDQLCKECRNNYPVVKCTYCRSEFQQNEKTAVSSICKKCSQNVKAYGKPRACEYCNIIAAFIGNRCQRCANSEKRWGPPKICDQCKQQCAFERGHDSRKKVEGKILCWLCTMAYKRVLVKTMKAREFTRSVVTDNSGSSNLSSQEPAQKQTGTGQDDEAPYSPGSGYPPTGDDTGGATTQEDSAADDDTPYSPGGCSGLEIMEEVTGEKSSAANTPSAKSDHMTPGSSSQTSWTKDSKDFSRALAFKHKLSAGEEDKSELKKLKLEKSATIQAANGIAKSASMSDFGNTDNIVMLTQMKEKIESLKKQLTSKDVQILERDKRLTELKAQNFEAEKKMRERIELMQKNHQSDLNRLQTKNRELQKQVTSLSKSSKKS